MSLPVENPSSGSTPLSGPPKPARATGDLTDLVARTSGRMLTDQTVDAVLHLLTSTVADVYPAVAGAGLTVVDGDTDRVTVAGTDALVRTADAQQYALGEGPCLTAWAERAVVRVDDLADETRWPRWARAARDLGLASALSAPLLVGDEALGALKLYARSPHTFTSRHEDSVRLFAAQAAVLLGAAQAHRRAGHLDAELHEALHRREVISQATGIVMGRDLVPATAAFMHLVARSRRERRPVHEVAERLVGTVGRGGPREGR